MNIKDAIETLKNIDIADIKEIDWVGAKHKLINRLDLMISTGIIIVSFIVGAYFIIHTAQVTGELSTQNNELNLQLEMTALNEKLKGQYDQFLKDFPKQQSVDQVLDTLSSYALEKKIKILSYTPAQSEDKDYLRIHNFTISVVAEDYQKILGFLKMIEESPYALRLESWIGDLFSESAASTNQPRSSRRSQRQKVTVSEEVQESVKVQIELSLIELKR